MIRLFLDSCAFDLLLFASVRLEHLAINDRVGLFVTRPTLIELQAAQAKNPPLFLFARAGIDSGTVRVFEVFGFDQPGLDDGGHRFGGFDSGEWAPEEFGSALARLNTHVGSSLRKSGLYSNEGDLWLAAISLSGGIVITAESANKSGPMRDARRMGGAILHINRTEFGYGKAPLRVIAHKLDQLENVRLQEIAAQLRLIAGDQ